MPPESRAGEPVDPQATGAAGDPERRGPKWLREASPSLRVSGRPERATARVAT